MQSIDRITPTRRHEDVKVVMRQRWAELLFLHWRVPASVLQPMLPPRLTLDTFEGHAYVGLVPFTMTGVRPVWAPAFRPVSDFHEVNVRTYVHHAGRDPGVWFFSLDAANPLAVIGARTVWRLPYHRARMTLEREPSGQIAYRSERLWPGPRPAVCDVRYAPEGPVRPAEPGSLEFFLAERYVLYATGRGGTLYRGRVHHTPYPLQAARADLREESLLSAARIDRAQTTPLAHYANEVSVDVFSLERI
jgi:uncharacterized protein YqjF (DUF2071 family)